MNIGRGTGNGHLFYQRKNKMMYNPEEKEVLMNTMVVLTILLQNLDRLEEQKYFAREVKFHGKQLLAEAEKLSKRVFEAVPQADKKVVNEAHWEYYKLDSEILDYVLNLSPTEKETIFKVIKGLKNVREQGDDKQGPR